jgi:hypothetical protein
MLTLCAVPFLRIVMTVQVLVIDEDAKKRIAEVVFYAEDNRYNAPKLHALVEGAISPPGDNPELVCYLDGHYRIVYSIEEQPCGWCRHLSVSIDQPNKVPHPSAVEMIMPEFGFKGGLHDCLTVWIESNAPTPLGNEVDAVNLLQRME